MAIREIIRNKKYKIELFIGRNGSKKVIGFIKTTNQTNNEYEAAFISLIKLEEEELEQFYGYCGNYFGKVTQNGIPDKKGLYQ